VAAFKYSQGASIKIAHHLNVPVQVIRAVSWKIPAVVLIRNPGDAVISLIIRTPFIPVRQALRNYYRFYDPLVNYRGGFVLAAFDKVLADFGGIIEKVNKRFNTNFKCFEHTTSNLDAVFNIIEQKEMANRNKKNITERTVARPSKKRENLKTKFVREFDKPNIIDLYRKALDIYQSFVDDIAL
jgi:hypothetical protein